LTPEQEKNTGSLPELESPLRFNLPEVQDIEVYILKDAEGKIIARTGDELKEKSE